MRNDLEIVVAVDEDWGIGLAGSQTLVVPEDRRRFRELTAGAAVIVGRRTLADFPGGKPLKNRRNIVLSRNEHLSIPGAEVAHSVEEALEMCEGAGRVFVIGGESVYRALLPHCRLAHVTRFFAKAQNDAFFPDLASLPGWRLADPGDVREHDGLKYSFQLWERPDKPDK